MDENKDAEKGKLQIGSKVNENVTCSQCQKEVSGNEAYTYQGKDNAHVFLCSSCRQKAETALQAETKNPNMMLALVLGSVAAVVAGIIWYYFVILTGYQVGYIAIGVGFIIGWAVVIGSGQKRGSSLQIMSAVMTFLTLFVAEYFMALHYLRNALLNNKAEYPDYNGEFFFVSPFDADLLSNMISPMGLLIWGIGIYFAYSIPKSRAL
jgi:hypothetical protein